MKPETAAAIARKIGVRYSDDRWLDEASRVIKDLPAYLATGDRPLRVFEALCADGWRFVIRTLTGKVMILWARRVESAGPGDAVSINEGQSASGATLAAAILACAAALEEGHD